MRVRPSLVDSPCPLGCPRKDRYLFSGSDRLHGLPGRFSVVECVTCSLRRTNPRPSPETIGAYYPETYRVHQPTAPRGTSALPEGRRSASLRSIASRLLDTKSKALPDLQPGFLYEVGCGNGGFLAWMRDHGWRVEGLELSAHAVQSARQLGLTVTHAPLEDAPVPAEAPSLIVAWMVLEHLFDPIAALRQLRQWAAPGAYLVLSVPNANSREFSFFRDDWYALQLPTHLFHFTPSSLERVLNASGWRMTRLFHHRNLNNLAASLGYRVSDRGGPEWLATRLKAFPARASRWQMMALRPFAGLMAAAGQTGRMTVWAQVDANIDAPSVTRRRRRVDSDSMPDAARDVR